MFAAMRLNCAYPPLLLCDTHAAAGSMLPLSGAYLEGAEPRRPLNSANIITPNADCLLFVTLK